MPHSSFTTSLQVFLPEYVTFWSVSGQIVGSDVSSAGSCSSFPPEAGPTSMENSIKKVGMQTGPHLLHLQESKVVFDMRSNWDTTDEMDGGSASKRGL